MSGRTLETLRQRHAELVKRIHGTKLILTGNKLRAAQTFYVVGTFAACYGVLCYFSPDQDKLQAELPRARHTGTQENRPEGLAALQQALEASRLAKEEAERAKAR